MHRTTNNSLHIKQMEDFSLITRVLDKYFDFCKEPGEEYSLAGITEFIPKEMLDNSKKEDESGYSFWLPLKSSVTEKEIAELESFFRHPLPGSFKYFLQQQHFIEIYFDEILFFGNPPGKLAAVFKEKIDACYPSLPGRNYLPFASYRNDSVLAFNANRNAAGNEYEIVMLDHEDQYKTASFYAAGFLPLFYIIDKQLDQSIKQIRDYRDNS